MTTATGVPIARSTLGEVWDGQDTILFNHSLEHVPDPAADLRHAAGLLPQDGRCIVRIPTPSSRIYETYGADWVQLDAPRHLFLPSRKGMAALAGRTGFRLETVIDDSWAFGFWGSELFRADIPLQRYATNPAGHFGKARIRAWAREARALNAAGRGDQAAFVLRRI
jgi:SAM-dependent methyltransferase